MCAHSKGMHAFLRAAGVAAAGQPRSFVSLGSSVLAGCIVNGSAGVLWFVSLGWHYNQRESRGAKYYVFVMICCRALSTILQGMIRFLSHAFNAIVAVLPTVNLS